MKCSIALGVLNNSLIHIDVDHLMAYVPPTPHILSILRSKLSSICHCIQRRGERPSTGKIRRMPGRTAEMQ